MEDLLKQLSFNQGPSQEQERAEKEKADRYTQMMQDIGSPTSVADDNNEWMYDTGLSQNINNMYKCVNKEIYNNYSSKYDKKIKEYYKNKRTSPNQDERYDLCNAAIEEVDNASLSITKLFKNIISKKKKEKEIKETTINNFIDFYNGTLTEDFDKTRGLKDFNDDPIFRRRVLCRCYIEGDSKLKPQVEEFIKKYSIQIDLDNCILKRIEKKEPPNEPQTFRDQLEKAVNIMSINASERLYKDEDYKRARDIISEAERRMKERKRLKDAKKPPRMTKVLTEKEKQEAKNKKDKPFIQPAWNRGGKRTKKSYKKSKKANTRKHKKSKKVRFKNNKKTRKN